MVVEKNIEIADEIKDSVSDYLNRILFVLKEIESESQLAKKMFLNH